MIIICGYRIKYLQNVTTNHNDSLQIGQIPLCIILQGTGYFFVDVVIQILLFIIEIFQTDEYRIETLYQHILIHITFIGVKYITIKKLKGIFVVKRSLNELLSFVNKTLNIDFFMTYLDPITSDLQIYDYNQKFAKTTGQNSKFKEFLSKIKIDIQESDIKEDELQKKEPTLKDYLLERHWAINQVLEKGKNIPKTKISQYTDDTKLYRSSLDNIKLQTPYNINVNQNQICFDSPTSCILQKQLTSKQNSQIYQTQQRKQSPSIENGSQFMFNKFKRISEGGGDYNRSKTNTQKDIFLERLKQLSRVDTLYGVHLDEQFNKKIYYKIKVSVIQMERAFLGITLENQTEKKEYFQQKGNFKVQQNMFAQSLQQMRSQAIETIKLCKSISAQQMVPLLSQINLMDCLQDYLYRKQDQKSIKVNKSNFSLKSLLKEIEDIFQVQLVIGGDQNCLSIQQNSQNNFLFQKPQGFQYQGKIQRDSIFSRLRNNSATVFGQSDAPLSHQLASNQPQTNNLIQLSKETTCQSFGLTPNQGKGSEEQIFDSINNVHVHVPQGDQHIINNDIYKLRQILIALVTNMIYLNKDLLGKKSAVEKENQDQNNSFENNLIELICTEETSQLFDFYKLKFKLQCTNASLIPRREALLKYLNGSRDAAINKVCLRQINSNIQVVGPYKLNAEITDEKQIEISFDIFKNIDIMYNRDKDYSFHSQSQLTSQNNFTTTPPLMPTKGSILANNFSLNNNYTHNNIKQQQSKSFLLSNRIKKLLHGDTQNNNNHNNQMNSPIKTLNQQNSKIEQNQNINDLPSFSQRNGESEKFVTQSYEQSYNSNLNFQQDSSFRQVQQNMSNSIYNSMSIKDGFQQYSHSPCIDSECEQQEYQNNKQLNLNSAIKTYLKNKSPSLQVKNKPIINKQIICAKSKSSTNLETPTDSITRSFGCLQDENNDRSQLNTIRLINQTFKVHTISSINNFLN